MITHKMTRWNGKENKLDRDWTCKFRNSRRKWVWSAIVLSLCLNSLTPTHHKEPMLWIHANGTSFRSSGKLGVDRNNSRMDQSDEEALPIGPMCQANPWPTVIPAQIYVCGYFLQEKVVRNTYPELDSLETIRLTQSNFKNTTKNDVLIMRTDRPCGVSLQQMLHSFPGMVFHVNGEAYGGEVWDRYVNSISSQDQWRSEPTKSSSAGHSTRGSEKTLSHPPPRNLHLGYVADSEYSVRLFYGNMAISIATPKEQELLFDHSKKPRNTGEAFLIYTNSNCHPLREKAFDSIITATLSNLPQPLARSEMAHKGGKCWGYLKNASLVRETQWPSPRSGWGKNYKMYRHYRFCFVPDKRYTPGYVTEKIVEAFWAGCIPIYYGTEEVFDIFNRHAFIYYNMSDPQPSLDQIAHLQSNQMAYNHMLDQPILANGTATIERFFLLKGDGIGKQGSLKQKIRETVCALSGDRKSGTHSSKKEQASSK